MGDENINDAFVYEELLKNDYSDYSDSFHTTKMMKKHQNKSKKEKTIYNSNSFSRENQSKNKNDKDISKMMGKLDNQEEFLHLLKNDTNHNATQKPDSTTIPRTKAGSGNERNEFHSTKLETEMKDNIEKDIGFSRSSITERSFSIDNINSNKNTRTNKQRISTHTTTTTSSTPTPNSTSKHEKDAIKGKTETPFDKNDADEELDGNNAISQKHNLTSENNSELMQIDTSNGNINDALVYEELLKNSNSDYYDNFHTINMRENQNQKTENESVNHITSIPERKISNKNIDTDISKTVEKLENDSYDVNHNTQAGSGNEKSISDDYGYSDYSDNFHTINMRDNHNQKTENESDNHITSVPERKISNKNIDTDISKTVEKLEKQDEFLILLKNESNDVNHNNTKKLNLMTISDTKAGSENEKSISNDNENLNKNIRTNETTTPTTTTSSSTTTPRLPSTHGKEAIKGKTETSVDKNKADEELKSNNALSQKLNLSSDHPSESIHNDVHDENIN